MSDQCSLGVIDMKTAKRRPETSGWKQCNSPAKLSPAQGRAILRRIDKLRKSIGPIGCSTAEIIREIREGGLFMPDPPAKPSKKPGTSRRIEIPEPTRKPNAAQRALMKRMERFREAFGKPVRPIVELIREMHDSGGDLRH